MKKILEYINTRLECWKEKREDFFVRMANYKLSYFTSRIIVSYIFMIICAGIAFILFIVNNIQSYSNNATIVFMVIFILLTIVFMLLYVVLIFFKNSLQFKLGKLSSGLISFAILVAPIYIILLICYVYIPQGREIIKSILTATTFSATILTIMGVHYTLVYQRNDRIDKNNLIFQIYDKADSESNFKIQNALGELCLQLKIKNVSNNYGFIVGLYKLCGCDIYQIGDDFPYLSIYPNNCLSITNIRINYGDDELILVYKDISNNFYFLLLTVCEKKICRIEMAGKCDFDFLQNQILETDETEKAVGAKERSEKTIKPISWFSAGMDINERKVETKPIKTQIVDGFDVIVSDDGEIKTDTQLLSILKKERLKLAKEKKIKAYMIFNNQQLVALATYKPIDEKSFISIYGLGKKKFDLYGEQFIQL